MHRGLDGFGAGEDRLSSQHAGDESENATTDAPYPHQPTRFGCALRHKIAEPAPMNTLVLAGLVQEGQKVSRTHAGCDDLR